ncbi:MAG TPA: PilC/PilY family type IV pilus protein [Rubrivivax sp.]|nr:PilC/PilY family type IV pilus protein [Rubrivivax sp.]
MNKSLRPAPIHRLATPALRLLQAALATAFAAGALVSMPSRAELIIGNNPLYLVMGKANVLVVLDNSNSMDEDASGAAVGSASPNSKSEMARSVVRNLTDLYRNRVNMGLMAYRQNAPDSMQLHNSPYDASYDSNNYDPGWNGARASANHKKYRMPNPTSAGNFVYYNVALPFYSAANYNNAFCYSNTADASADFGGGVIPGSWDNYRCFQTKTGTSDALPTWGDAASEALSGYTNYWFTSSFFPTDSDYAQGITDFGRYMTWSWVSTTWFRNESPGRGFLHVPLKDLGAAQAASIKTKLACNIPGTPAGCTNDGIRNAGLTPIEGTLLTALDYYSGTWNNADEGYVAACYPLPESCKKNFVVLLTDGLPSTSKDGVTLANPAAALAAAAGAAGSLKAAGIETYVIGFALPYGVDSTTLDQVAVAGGTKNHHKADDTVSLQKAFDTIFDDIFKKTSAFGSVSQNSTAINTGSMIFQGRFDSTTWSGEVAAMKPDDQGNTPEIWSSAGAGKIPAAAARKVFTLKPGVGGKEFKLIADLDAAQLGALSAVNCSAALTGNDCAQARIDWIRGDRTKEDAPLRKRTSVHGDVISSAPYYVKATNTVYVGANDGLLHAMDAANGNELFSYVPNALFPKLYKLTQSSYTHDYYVDGEIAVSTSFETPGKSILVGALGRGGKALYALDVTAPASFDASKVLWEYTDADLGLVLGKPIIAKMNNGKAAVIVGNGYNSATERGMLLIIDVETGALIRKIDTGAGGAAATNGLASPRGWDSDGNGTLDFLYVGDLLGNVWKFDLTAAAPASWGSAFADPFFVAVDGNGVRQPITGMVGLGINARKGDPNFGKRYVFFGTGRYITSDDVTNKQTMSWYGLIDEGAAILNGRTDLKQRTIEIEDVLNGNAARAFSLAAANDMVGKKGWYIDLVSPTNGALGERMIGEHKLFDQVLLASSMIPDPNQCKPGGSGYLNAVDPFTGAALGNLFFDANNDLKFNDSDRLGVQKRALGSIDPGINLPSDGILIGNRIISSGTSGKTSSKSVSNRIRTGRITWREVVTQ